jgi:hypothetical protein
MWGMQRAVIARSAAIVAQRLQTATAGTPLVHLQKLASVSTLRCQRMVHSSRVCQRCAVGGWFTHHECVNVALSADGSLRSAVGGGCRAILPSIAWADVTSPQRLVDRLVIFCELCNGKPPSDVPATLNHTPFAVVSSQLTLKQRLFPRPWLSKK